MVHNELRLISKIIETRDMRSVVRARMSASLFRNPEARAMYEEVWRYYHNPSHYGETPKPGWMESKFQSFVIYPDIQETVPELIEYVRRDTLGQRVFEAINEAYELIAEGAPDPDQALKTLGQRVGEMKAISAGKGNNFMLHEVTEEIWERYCEKERLRESGGVSGIPWPWEPLNRVTSGMEKEQLIIIYGMAKSMKTMFAIELAMHAYLWSNRRVVLYSAEMPRNDMMERMAACMAELDYGRIERGTLNAEEKAHFRKALEFIREEGMENPSGRGPCLYYTSDADSDNRGSVSLVRAYAEEVDADLVIVDSFYRMGDDRSGTVGLDWKIVGNVAQDMKGMAKALGIPVIGVTQSNEAGKLGFSKVIGMETDLAMFVEVSDDTPEYTDLDIHFPLARKIKQPGFRLRVNPYSRFSFEGWLEYQSKDTGMHKASHTGVELGKSPMGPPRYNDASHLIDELATQHLS